MACGALTSLHFVSVLTASAGGIGEVGDALPSVD
jgi:hypothetical protein